MVPGLDVEALGKEGAPSDFVMDEGAGWVFRVGRAEEPVRKAPDSCSDVFPSASPSLPTFRSASSSSSSSESAKAYATGMSSTCRSWKSELKAVAVSLEHVQLEHGKPCWDELRAEECNKTRQQGATEETLGQRGSSCGDRPQKVFLLCGGVRKSGAEVSLKNEVLRQWRRSMKGGTYEIRGSIAHDGQKHVLLHLSSFSGVNQVAQLTAVVVIKIEPSEGAGRCGEDGAARNETFWGGSLPQ
ncbi:hypothetical protein B0H14DRAFT_2625413 [Mycena olivaceomarginata]|nr:hypothetical protein B0H14DRAFT_2625413 [Mycena olivaceomarginata]